MRGSLRFLFGGTLTGCPKFFQGGRIIGKAEAEATTGVFGMKVLAAHVNLQKKAHPALLLGGRMPLARPHERQRARER